MPHWAKKLIRGDRLPSHLREQVLRMYVRRLTVENARQTYGGRCPACSQVQFPHVTGQALKGGRGVHDGAAQYHKFHAPLVTDEQWLREHAFYVTKQGWLSRRQKYAEPARLAD